MRQYQFRVPEKLSKVLFETLEKLELKNRVEDGLVLNRWDEIVGQSISKNAQPQFVKGRILFVATSSAVWAQELNFIKKEILEKINRELKREIKDIRFQPRGQVAASLQQVSPEQSNFLKIKNTRLGPEDSKKITSLTAVISDEKVRRKLTELFILDTRFKI